MADVELETPQVTNDKNKIVNDTDEVEDVASSRPESPDSVNLK